eukprot:GHVU01173465.1.p1 GENE.GHVU01173465.1~~GHVU01173465.1.p1  ORF type:complete len:291 (+),score=56.69 GHVU01173465.1:62-934(+)
MDANHGGAAERDKRSSADDDPLREHRERVAERYRNAMIKERTESQIKDDEALAQQLLAEEEAARNSMVAEDEAYSRALHEEWAREHGGGLPSAVEEYDEDGVRAPMRTGYVERLLPQEDDPYVSTVEVHPSRQDAHRAGGGGGAAAAAYGGRGLMYPNNASADRDGAESRLLRHNNNSPNGGGFLPNGGGGRTNSASSDPRLYPPVAEEEEDSFRGRSGARRSRGSLGWGGPEGGGRGGYGGVVSNLLRGSGVGGGGGRTCAGVLKWLPAVAVVVMVILVAAVTFVAWRR